MHKLILAVVCFVIVSGLPGFGAPSHWSVIGRIHIGGDGGWDYLVTQPETHRLFVSHARQVVVVDMRARTIIGSIPANGVHGIALAPDLNRGFISNGTDGTVTCFDLTTLKIIAMLRAEQNPDAICYEPTTHRVFAFNGRSGTATVIDAVGEKVIGAIALAGKPEFAAADGRGSVFDALEDKNQILKINASTLAIEARWKLPANSAPSGLAIDAAHERLFIGCGNRTMVILDGVSGRIISTLPIGEGVDACVYDPVGQRAFASCGDGTMTVVQGSGDHLYTVAEKVTTQPRARTMAFDPTTATAYLPIAKFGPMPPATPDHPKPRPPVLPGTLEILIVSEKS